MDFTYNNKNSNRVILVLTTAPVKQGDINPYIQNWDCSALLILSGDLRTMLHYQLLAVEKLLISWFQEQGPSSWFQPIWKILHRQIGSFPQVGRGENKKHLSCHHLGTASFLRDVPWLYNLYIYCVLPQHCKNLVDFCEGQWSRSRIKKTHFFYKVWAGPKN